MLGEQTPIRPEYRLVFSRDCEEWGLFSPSARTGLGCPEAAVAVPQPEVLLPAFAFK